MGEKREKIDGLFFDLVKYDCFVGVSPIPYLWRWGGSGGVIYGDVVWLWGCVWLSWGVLCGGSWRGVALCRVWY